jgi:hypothetical protein
LTALAILGHFDAAIDRKWNRSSRRNIVDQATARIETSAGYCRCSAALAQGDRVMDGRACYAGAVIAALNRSLIRWSSGSRDGPYKT